MRVVPTLVLIGLLTFGANYTHLLFYLLTISWSCSLPTKHVLIHHSTDGPTPSVDVLSSLRTAGATPELRT